MRISYTYEVPMGHRLQAHPGKCRFLHGHNYLVTATVKGPVSDTGMVMDFAALKAAVTDTLRPYDHAMVLQDSDPAIAAVKDHANVVTVPFPPTAEMLAFAWHAEIARVLDCAGRLAVEVRETRDCGATTP